jgi:preprotein translocase SecE subunit
MFKFLNDAKAELEHVVWPTPNETKKYMYYNIAVIFCLTIFLMIAGYMIQESLLFTRSQFTHESTLMNSGSELATQGELDELARSLQQNIQTGSVLSGAEITVSSEVSSGRTGTQSIQ